MYSIYMYIIYICILYIYMYIIYICILYIYMYVYYIYITTRFGIILSHVDAGFLGVSWHYRPLMTNFSTQNEVLQFSVEKKPKKNETNSRFFTFWDFQRLAKNRPFWWPPAGNHQKRKNEKTTKKKPLGRIRVLGGTLKAAGNPRDALGK